MKRPLFYCSYFLLIIIIYTCSGCRSAQWHLDMAVKKDPSILDIKTKTTLQPMFIESVSTNLDCVELMKSGYTPFKLPVRVTNPVTKKDTTQYVDVSFKPSETDSTKLEMTIDCPDPLVSHTETATTYIKKPTFIEFLGYYSVGFILGIIFCFFFALSKEK